MIPTLSVKLVTNQKELVKSDQRERLIKILHETALEMASIARQLCPVDTGFLRSSIAIESSREGMFIRLVVGAFYAGYVEYGTPFSAAQPFIRPAAQSVHRRMRARLGQVQSGLGRTLGVGRTRVQRLI